MTWYTNHQTPLQRQLIKVKYKTWICTVFALEALGCCDPFGLLVLHLHRCVGSRLRVDVKNRMVHLFETCMKPKLGVRDMWAIFWCPSGPSRTDVTSPCLVYLISSCYAGNPPRQTTLEEAFQPLRSAAEVEACMSACTFIRR